MAEFTPESPTKRPEDLCQIGPFATVEKTWLYVLKENSTHGTMVLFAERSLFWKGADYLLELDEALSRYLCSPRRTSSPLWLWTVALVVTKPISP